MKLVKWQQQLMDFNIGWWKDYLLFYHFYSLDISSNYTMHTFFSKYHNYPSVKSGKYVFMKIIIIFKHNKIQSYLKVLALSVIFLVLFLGNFFTTWSVIRKKIKGRLQKQIRDISNFRYKYVDRKHLLTQQSVPAGDKTD
jgi:hypothetical protein